MMNIYDIAREADVSIATVSRVINKPETVAPATRSRVQEVIKRNAYNPDAVARGLSGAAMKTIGVLAEDSRIPYHAHITWAIEQESRRQGYSVILCNTGKSTSDQKQYFNVLKTKRVDAIICVGSIYQVPSLRKTIKETAAHIPVIMINGQFSAPGTYSINCDDRKGMALCVDHMVERGYRDLVYLSYGNTISAKLKLEGYKSGIERNGLSRSEKRILYCDERITAGMDAAASILELDLSCSGIVCEDTVLAAGVMKFLQQKGVRIPDDFAISGYNSTYISEFLLPELTVVDGKIDYLGTMAVRNCLDLLEGLTVPPVLEIEPEIRPGLTT